MLEATVRDPSRSGPGTKLVYGLHTAEIKIGVGGDPTPFSRLRGVHSRDMELTPFVVFLVVHPKTYHPAGLR
ncbi:MAG TPA: hypothetical protein VEH31_21230, partial [Streptosporangiaceae bacterium]|nr:hypothetical protein [Streptosporangiaceae bacterium]